MGKKNPGQPKPAPSDEGHDSRHPKRGSGPSTSKPEHGSDQYGSGKAVNPGSNSHQQHIPSVLRYPDNDYADDADADADDDYDYDEDDEDEIDDYPEGSFLPYNGSLIDKGVLLAAAAEQLKLASGNHHASQSGKRKHKSDPFQLSPAILERMMELPAGERLNYPSEMRSWTDYQVKLGVLRKELKREKHLRLDLVNKLKAQESRCTMLESLCRNINAENKHLKKFSEPAKEALKSENDQMASLMQTRCGVVEQLVQSNVANDELKKTLLAYVQLCRLREEHAGRLKETHFHELAYTEAKLSKVTRELEDTKLLLAEREGELQQLKDAKKKQRVVMTANTRAWKKELADLKDAFNKNDLKFRMQVGHTSKWVQKYNKIGQTVAKYAQENVVLKARVAEHKRQIAAQNEMYLRLQQERVAKQKQLTALKNTAAAMHAQTTQPSTAEATAATLTTTTTTTTTAVASGKQLLSGRGSTPSDDDDGDGDGGDDVGSSDGLGLSVDTVPASLQKYLRVSRKQALMELQREMQSAAVAKYGSKNPDADGASGLLGDWDLGALSIVGDYGIGVLGGDGIRRSSSTPSLSRVSSLSFLSHALGVGKAPGEVSPHQYTHKGKGSTPSGSNKGMFFSGSGPDESGDGDSDSDEDGPAGREDSDDEIASTARNARVGSSNHGRATVKASSDDGLSSKGAAHGVEALLNGGFPPQQQQQRPKKKGASTGSNNSSKKKGKKKGKRK